VVVVVVVVNPATLLICEISETENEQSRFHLETDLN